MNINRKYVVVRKNSCGGAFIVARNENAPDTLSWSKADIAGYARNLREAEKLAKESNEEDERAASVCADLENAEQEAQIRLIINAVLAHFPEQKIRLGLSNVARFESLGLADLLH